MMKPKNSLRNRSLMLSPLFLLLVAFACSKEEIVDPSQDVNAYALPATNGNATMANARVSATAANLFFEEKFEGVKPFSTAHAIENSGLGYALSYISSPAYQGLKAARFEVQKGQPLVGSSKKIRSEVTIVKGTEDSRITANIWYSYAIYFPAVGFESDDTRDCINQWYEDGSDETTIRSQYDKLFLEVTPASGSSTLMKYDLFKADANATGGTSSSSKGVKVFNSIPKNAWNEFVFHFVHSTGSDGLIEVWRNGVKIHHITGRNMHLELPKWKIGLYKASFLDGSSTRSSRVVYFDNVRVGSANATLADMMSGATAGGVASDPAPVTPTLPKPAAPTTPTTPTTPVTPTVPSVGGPVVSFTLVNAHTEKDVMTITEGATISLSALGLSKVNIRANTNGSSIGSIKFALSGTQTSTYIDNFMPFALHGDDLKGNYYYGTWRPPALGSYTLQATPYSGSKAAGTAGTPASINFTIVK